MNKQRVPLTSFFAFLQKTALLLFILTSPFTVAAQCPGNLLTNPSFENGLQDWAISGDASLQQNPHSGIYSVQLGENGFASIGQALPTTSGSEYTVKVWAKHEGISWKALQLRFLDASFVTLPGTLQTEIASIDYSEYSLTGIAPSGAAYVYAIAAKDGSGSVEVDDFCLLEGSAPPPIPEVVCPADTLASQAEVDAWAGCTVVEGTLRIAGNDITDLSPLSTLQKVRGGVIIDDNPSLISLSGLENLDSVEALIITDNPILQSFEVLAGMNQTDIAAITLNGNSSVTTIGVFNNFINSDFLSIRNNAALESITGFVNLATSGLNNPTTSGGLIQIFDNPNLTDLSGFSNLTAINSQLIISNNDALTEINGFGNLSTLADLIIISGNDNLLNINGFSSLSSPNGFAIASNNSLQNLDALSSISSIPGLLNVLDNPSLTDCCGLYPMLNSGGVGGNLSISGNPMPCSNESDILDNCVPSGDIDLSLSMNQPNATPSQWSSYDVVLTIQNSGGQTATGVEVSFAKPAGVVYTGGNEFTASQGTFNAFSNEVWTVGSIPAGGSATLTVSYFLLVSESPVAWAEVSAANETDGDSTPGNGISPAVNEDDEASTGGGGPPNLTPDLTLANLDIQNSPVQAGQVLNYQFDISNQGTGPVSGNFNVKPWISTDAVISPNDIQDGIVPTGNYGAGFTQTDIPGASTIPGGLAAGQYYLILKVDADDEVAESNEGNNTVAMLFTVEGGGTGGSSCSFTTYYTPSGFDPLDITFGRDFDFMETSNGYSIFQETDTYEPVVPSPQDFDTYELDLEGNVTAAFETPIVPNIDVVLESVGEDDVEMTFNLSPDLPAGTVVPIDLDYPNPPAAVYVSSQAKRTSWGYAFGVAIVDLSLSPNVVNRIYMTDHTGQNVTFAELPDPDFYFGTNQILEGPDGSLFTDWRTSGNFSLFVVPADGSAAWQARVASDTPSSSWIETEISDDGQFVYTMKTDNSQVYVAKYDVSTGAELGIDLVEMKTSSFPTGFRLTWAHGIEPTADGGLLVSLRADEAGTSPLDDFEVLAKYDATGNLVCKTEIPEPGFSLTPVGETSDGGVLFAGAEGTEFGPAPTYSVFLKTAENGALTPECDGGGTGGGGDIDLSLEMTTSNPSPSIYSSTEVTVEITNAGPMTATGIVVDFPRPAGTVYTGGNEWDATQGTFNPFGNEKWTVGSLPAGESASLTVGYFLLTGNTLTPYAQVDAANETDGDSAPANGTCCTPNEDDEATLTLNAFSGGGGIALAAPEKVGRDIQLLKVYPTPAYHGEVNLSLWSKNEREETIEIYDSFGCLAFRQRTELRTGFNDVRLDLSEFRSGVYQVHIPGHDLKYMPRSIIIERW